MTSWKNRLTRLAVNAEDAFDQLKMRVSRRLRLDDPLLIQPYYGFGNAQQVTLKGRLLQNEGVRRAGDRDSVWRNMLNIYRQLESDEVPGATIAGTLQGVTAVSVTDEEGYFTLSFTLPAPLPPDQLWHEVALTLRALPGDAPTPTDPTVTAVGHVLTPPQMAAFGVISDIDDTILQSSATNYLHAARLLFLHNARTRLPFLGVSAFYQALQLGVGSRPHNPIFYVSSSPWNVFLLLTEFFEFQGVPQGPLFLKDYGLSADQLLSSGHRKHKLAQIETILDTYPSLPFVLIGDSGQKDPEIYAEVARAYPGRIRAIYIRDVSDDRRDQEVRTIAHTAAESGTPMLLTADSLAAATHAAEIGLITPEGVTAVAEAMVAAETQELLEELDDDTASANH